MRIKKLSLVYLGLNIAWTFGQFSIKPRFERPSVKTPVPDYENIASSICELSKTIASTPGFICKGQLLFEDNFNYTKIKQGKTWIPEIMFPGAPDFPFNVYLVGEHMRIDRGSLSIKPVKLNSQYGEGFILRKMDLPECTGRLGTAECSREAIGPRILPPIITGKITTKKSFSFKYGKIEVRAKMPQGSWIVPEIQLEPLYNKYGTQNYSSGILRIASVKGNLEFSRTLYGGPMLCASRPLRTKYLKELMNPLRWSADYHTYTLDWRPDMIRLFVDGKKYGEVKPKGSFADEVTPRVMIDAAEWKKGDPLAPFDEMFYLSLGITIGGVNEFPDDELKPWTNTHAKAMLNFWNAQHAWFPTWSDDNELLVDYVKVYAL